MNEEDKAINHIESRFHKARGFFTDARDKGADPGIRPLADGLIVMIDGLLGLAQQVDQIRASRSEH
jgi:hypothetical protein